VTLLRGGGNRNGADAVVTWQTGFPLAVDFRRGVPRYRPRDGSAGVLLERGEIDAALVVGSAQGVPSSIAGWLKTVPTMVIGPRASASAMASAAAIDTGIAGVHEEGMALRLDDVPLPVRAVIDGFPSTTSIVQSLCERIVTVRRDA
jgi:formylmethanofuran dehydrogenase subunit B